MNGCVPLLWRVHICVCVTYKTLLDFICKGLYILFFVKVYTDWFYHWCRVKSFSSSHCLADTAARLLTAPPIWVCINVMVRWTGRPLALMDHRWPTWQSGNRPSRPCCFKERTKHEYLSLMALDCMSFGLKSEKRPLQFCTDD